MNHVKPQLMTKKIVTIVLYKFFHGIHETNATHMAYQFNVGSSTMTKYEDIIKLFVKSQNFAKKAIWPNFA
jgi:hypothetical protein